MNKSSFIFSIKSIIGLVIILFCFNGVQAQIKKKSGYESSSPARENNVVTTYLDSAQLLTNKAPLRAIDQINKAIELSIRNNDETNEALSYCILGNIQQNLGQHELALENYEKCIGTLSSKNHSLKEVVISKSADDDGKYSMNSNNRVAGANTTQKVKGFDKFADNTVKTTQSLFTAYKRMAFSFLQLNRFTEANAAIANCFGDDFQSVSNAEKLDARRVQSSILLKQGKPDESLGLLLNTLEEEKKQGSAEGEVKTLMAIASLYQQTKRESRAIDYYQQAKSLAEKINNTELSLSINTSMAQTFRQQNNLSKEIETRNNSIELSNTINKKMDAVTDELKPGTVITNEGEDDRFSVADYNQHDEKLEQSTLAEPLFSKSNDLEYTATTYKLLAEQYLKEGNNAKALTYLKTFAQIQDSIKNTRKRELDQALKISNALGKNQQRIDLLEKERNLSDRSIEVLKQDRELKENELFIRNIIIGTLLFLIVFMLGSGYYIFKSFREKRKANQLLAIKSLRGQMNPHFIFNALNSVNHYISQNDELAANKYLSDFSKLMRAVMETSKHDLISLAEELDIIKIYLQLEHSRFRDKFDYTFHLDESIDPSEFELPPMIIQPFIENAVWHGLRYMDEKGNLTIDVRRQHEQLMIVVTDNGIGRKKSLEIKTKNQKLQNSTGMQNIENRIRIMNELYKTDIRVMIGDAYPDASSTGTRVEILIPKKINHYA